jgi:hypothetical protein
VSSQQFSNLRFPAADAKAMAERFKREGEAPAEPIDSAAASPSRAGSAGASPSLYQKMEMRTLTDEQATLASGRAGLK